MCFALYLASDTPLPVIPWDATVPSLYVEKDTYHKPIPALSKPYVYYLGSHNGCGCGFLLDGNTPDTPEYRAIMQTYAQLANYLELATRDARVELFMSWEGEEGHDPQRNASIRPEDIRKGLVAFREGQLFVVEHDVPDQDCTP